MTVNATIHMKAGVSLVGSNAFSGGPNWSAEMELLQVFGSGTTANKVDLAYAAERTVSSGANDDIDLAGVLTDALGATITAAEVVAIAVVNKQRDGTANTTSLTIGGGSNPFVGFLGGTTPTITKIGPGAVLLLSSPDATGLGSVTAGTGDILRVTNAAGATNKYQIMILARSA